MTKKVWEKRLASQLKRLPKAERKKILDYYAEMYGDKLEEGLSEEEILAEFGSPEECAARILTEEGVNEVKQPLQNAEKQVTDSSVAESVGVFFLSLLLVLPLSICAFSLIVSFAAVALAGIAVGAAGVMYTVAAPFILAGSDITAGFAHFGVGLVLTGVGALLFAAFFLAAKYVVIGSKKGLEFLYARRYNK